MTLARPEMRLDLDPDAVACGFAQLVLGVADILRELIERQAIRRVEAGDLDADQIERLGTSLQRISEQIADLRATMTPRSARGAHPDLRREQP